MAEASKDSVENVYTQIGLVQSEVGTLKKDARSDHGMYTTISELTASAVPAMAKHGLDWLAYTDYVTVGDRLYVKQTVEVNHPQSGTRVWTTHVWPLQQNAQQEGSQETYNRRYGLISLLGLASADDDGAATVGGPQPQRGRYSAPVPSIDPKVKALLSALHEHGLSGQDSADYIAGILGRPVTNPAQLSGEEIGRVLTELSKRTPKENPESK